MPKFRLFITVLFLLTSIVLLVLLAIFDTGFYTMAVDQVKNYIWPAIIALVVFLVLLTTGIVTNLSRGEGSLFHNGLFQLAILELFLFSAALGYYWYHTQQPGNIVIRLQPAETKQFVNLGLKFQSADSTAIDTITAPIELHNRKAGRYSFETVDPEVLYFKTDLILKPASTETLFIPVTMNYKMLTVQTEPEGAEIWIDGLKASQTPDSFEIFNRDTVILQLKMAGYQDHIDTLGLADNIDLGVITLKKLYSLRISCQYEDIEYKIYDMDGNLVFASSGTRRVQLADGRYKLAYSLGEGQYETKSFVLNRNSSVSVP